MTHMDAARDTPAGEMSLLFDVWMVMHLASGMLDDALADAELSADDFGLYSLLRVFGPATPSQIARWTGMRATTVSAALKRLASRGHSVQQENPDDGRSYLVALSPSGFEAHARAAVPFLDVMAQVHRSLGPDVSAERVALQRLDAALRDTAGLPPRPYSLSADPASTSSTLSYAGPRLAPAQEAAARAYVDFLRTRPGDVSPGAQGAGRRESRQSGDAGRV